MKVHVIIVIVCAYMYVLSSDILLSCVVSIVIFYFCMCSVCMCNTCVYLLDMFTHMHICISLCVQLYIRSCVCIVQTF